MAAQASAEMPRTHQCLGLGPYRHNYQRPPRLADMVEREPRRPLFVKLARTFNEQLFMESSQGPPGPHAARVKSKTHRR